MKKVFLLFYYLSLLGLQAQNTHHVDVRVWEANTPNYKVESSYEPMSTDMMIAGTIYRVNKFNEYRGLTYAALKNEQTNYL